METIKRLIENIKIFWWNYNIKILAWHKLDSTKSYWFLTLELFHKIYFRQVVGKDSNYENSNVKTNKFIFVFLGILQRGYNANLLILPKNLLISKDQH